MTAPHGGLIPCSCGEGSAHVVGRRRTADGVDVYLWSDGAISGSLGYKLPGVPMRRPRTQDGRNAALRAGRLLLGEVELWDVADVPDLYRAAERVARNFGLPGDVRRLMRPAQSFPLRWSVTRADRDGLPAERQAILPRLRWPGLAVIDYCGGPGSARGRYELVSVAHNGHSGEVAATRTGFSFSSQRALFAHLFTA